MLLSGFEERGEVSQPVTQACFIERHVEELVPFGLGAVKGLSPLEHVEFAMTAPRPPENGVGLTADLLEAICFECFQSPEIVDSMRQSILARIIRLHAALDQEQSSWVREAPVSLQTLVASIHGPLWGQLLSEISCFSDQFLLQLPP